MEVYRNSLSEFTTISKTKTALGFPKRFYLCFVFSFGLLGFQSINVVRIQPISIV